MSALERINGDPVKLVESFDDLKQGMTLWSIGCGWCGGKHRGMVITAPIKYLPDPKNDGVEILPAPQHSQRFAIARESVARRQVFLVVDEPKAAPLSRVRLLEHAK